MQACMNASSVSQGALSAEPKGGANLAVVSSRRLSGGLDAKVPDLAGLPVSLLSPPPPQ